MSIKPHKKLTQRLLTLLAACCVLLVWVGLGWPCLIRHFTGLICPMCGMSRAWLAALRLDLYAALHYHPMFWSIPLFGVLALFDGRIFTRQWINKLLLWGTVILFALCYIIRLFVFLQGQMAL